jgi:hypothetical protein
MKILYLHGDPLPTWSVRVTMALVVREGPPLHRATLMPSGLNPRQRQTDSAMKIQWRSVGFVGIECNSAGYESEVVQHSYLV